MGDGDKHAETSETDELAKDIARLYSWAHVEDNPYRSFVRNRKLHRTVTASSQKTQESTNASDIPATAPYIENIGNVHDLSDSGGSAAGPTSVASSGVATAHASKSEAVRVSDAAQPLFTTPGHPERAPVEAPPPFDLKSGPSTLAIYSLAGGVGKTTICANLSRILCSMGERVLLIDASGSGLLPFYFGSSDFRSGFRTFEDPEGQYPPIKVLGETDEITTKWLDDAVKPAMQTVQRVIFDLGPASMNILPQILCRSSVLLVPLLTDLNSILTVSRIEDSIGAMKARGMNVPSPFYVFNLFDEQDPRDQEARKLISRQHQDHLLPGAIRYSHEFEDAIASRMTVADHAPDSEVVNDYTRLALWLRKVAPVRQMARPMQRWMER